ncbi:tyrosine-type recombinase/integrase [Pseudonocardia sp. RS010]|uniref:tyrosine-type recombinase/integrase n=1 Tax=Pseudonocardia sp. RS010 TaxID=3385979 RepID=UPI00399F4E4D
MAAPLPLADLLDSWVVTLEAERKSEETIRSYVTGVRAFLAWCTEQDRPALLDRATVNAFTAAILGRGAEATTARSRQLAVRRFSAWLAEEGEQDTDALLGMKLPKIDSKVVEVLTEDQLRALLRACAGREFVDRRDTAIIRLMIETGLRAGELVAMTLPDLDIPAGRAVIQRGKGGKGRVVPFGAQTAQALDRYVRARRTHRLAGTPTLWLGWPGKGFGYAALHKMIRSRGDAAGIERLHPHVLRHVAASRWLAAGGSEGGLMSVAGWQRREMLDRYARATASERAAEEARRLNLGDL